MVATFTAVRHPSDPVYQVERRKQVNELLSQSDYLLQKQLSYMLAQPAPRDESGETTRNAVNDLRQINALPSAIKGILDSTSGTSGNVLIRQDLEPVLYSLYVKSFPAFERLRKGPSNGLVHAFNQISAPDGLSLGGSLISELGSVSYTNSTFVRQTTPISVFATGRGVSFKEEAAVRQGGVDYKPLDIELGNAMVRLAQDVQYVMFQGNYSNSSGQSATTEGGAYNALAYDGFRGVIGSVGNFSANSAIQVDIGSLNITESIQFAASKAANNGGMPDLALMGMNSKQALDTENQANQRYNNDFTEVVPGVRASKVIWANGEIAILPVPGSTIGTYNRTSDNTLVEDIYVLDSSTVTLRWLYSEGMTVLQIPSGVDSQLSDRIIVFLMYGMEQAAPIFSAKCRRLAS